MKRLSLACHKGTNKSKTYVFRVFVILGTLNELLLLAPIDEGRKSGDDEHGQVNGSGIEPS